MWVFFFFFRDFGVVCGDGESKKQRMLDSCRKCQHLLVLTADCRQVIKTLSDSCRFAKSINPIQHSVFWHSVTACNF